MPDEKKWYTLVPGFADNGSACADIHSPEGGCIASELPTGCATTIVKHLNGLLAMLRSDHDYSHN